MLSFSEWKEKGFTSSFVKRRGISVFPRKKKKGEHVPLLPSRGEEGAET